MKSRSVQEEEIAEEAPEGGIFCNVSPGDYDCVLYVGASEYDLSFF